MSLETKPYVISADIAGLTQRWAVQNKITVPNESYLQGMQNDLSKLLGQYFTSIDVVSEEELKQGLNIKEGTMPENLQNIFWMIEEADFQLPSDLKSEALQLVKGFLDRTANTNLSHWVYHTRREFAKTAAKNCTCSSTTPFYLLY